VHEPRIEPVFTKLGNEIVFEFANSVDSGRQRALPRADLCEHNYDGQGKQKVEEEITSNGPVRLSAIADNQQTFPRSGRRRF
jgi:hypothetical protein